MSPSRALSFGEATSLMLKMPDPIPEEAERGGFFPSWASTAMVRRPSLSEKPDQQNEISHAAQSVEDDALDRAGDRGWEDRRGGVGKSARPCRSIPTGGWALRESLRFLARSTEFIRL